VNPIVLAVAAVGGYLVLKKSAAAGAGGPVPTAGNRTPPQPGRSPAGATAGQQGGVGTAAILNAGGQVVTAAAGAFVSIYDSLSTSQDSPPDPAPTPVQAPNLSGGSMAGSDWIGFTGASYDPGAGDALFTSAA